MAQAEICPVCEGKGHIERPDKTEMHSIICHGCEGKGWVEADETIAIRVREAVRLLNIALSDASRVGIKVELQQIDVTTVADKAQRLVFYAKLFKEI